MDREKVIKGLEFTKEMITFNPSTGEDIDPENLNEVDKMSYDACVGAIELLKEQEAVEPRVSTAEQRCGHCNKVIEMDGWQSCPWCGKRIDWKGWWQKNGTRNQDT